MNRTLEYLIEKQQEGLTVQELLKQQGYSTKIITHVKRTDMGLSVNGIRVRTNYVLTPGEVLKVSIIEESGSENIVPLNVPINIVYEDEDILVINKASDVPIHPSQGNFYNTLANMVTYYFKERGKECVFRCINRLDRDTTGLLILAKNMLSGCILSEMMCNREIHREYHAIVSGLLEGSGTIDAPIAREVDSTIVRCVNVDRGETAITHYNVLLPNNEHSYLSLQLETGRTHQIRVHMKYIGHTLLGDSLYGGDTSKIHRQALHSYRLRFIHPIKRTPLEFTSEIPEDMRKIIEYK